MEFMRDLTPLVREKVRGKWKVYFRGQVYNVGTRVA